MRFVPYACLGGVELSNHARTQAYATNVGVSGLTMSDRCVCDVLDEGYYLPDSDPAPWYEGSRPSSGEFLGLYANTIEVPSVFSRNVTQAGLSSSQLGPLTTKGRVVTVAGMMVASTAEGMAYGERWLSEALRGSVCDDCPGSDLLLLPACPEPGYDEDTAFRTLVNVGVVDGPIYTVVEQLPEWYVQQAAFVLSSTQPWLYHPTTRVLDAQTITGTLSAPLTTPEWMGEGTYRVEIENTGITAATNIVITGNISLDGSCPITGVGTSVPPTFQYTIASLAAEDRIIIDGMRRQVLRYDAAEKSNKSGWSSLSFDGPWSWPDVGPCTAMCMSITKSTGTLTATVDTVLREY